MSQHTAKTFCIKHVLQVIFQAVAALVLRPCDLLLFWGDPPLRSRLRSEPRASASGFASAPNLAVTVLALPARDNIFLLILPSVAASLSRGMCARPLAGSTELLGTGPGRVRDPPPPMTS